jgi:hypothetical protein
MAYNFAYDVRLLRFPGAPVGFFMYPQAETGDGRLESRVGQPAQFARANDGRGNRPRRPAQELAYSYLELQNSAHRR